MHGKLRITKLLMLAAVALAACLLSGCGASLTVYDYVENGKRVNVYELSLDADIVEKMESSAVSDADGEKYTVPGYFYKLFDRYGYTLTDARMDDDGFRALYRKEFSQGVPELYTVGSTAEYLINYDDDPFVRRVDRRSPNPFNGVRAAFDAVKPGQSGQLIQQLKNGVVAQNEYGETEVVFPSVQAAFPYLAGIDPDGLLLNYAVLGSKRMSSSGRAVSAGDDNSFYVFSQYFDGTESELEFNYTRPVPYGWYITALLAGGAVIAAIMFFTRQKKKKTTLLDRFPYNPEEYRDYDINLPTSLR